MDIYVGSLPFKLKETELQAMFETYGEVISATIVIDKITRQNKGFGFVKMAVDTEAYKAINALDGTEIEGRKIIVNKSAPKKEITTTRKRRSGTDTYSKEGNSGSGKKGGGHRSDF